MKEVLKIITWKKILIIYIIISIFSLSINFFIDIFLGYDTYFKGDFMYYMKINIPLVFLTVFSNFIFVLYLKISMIEKKLFVKFFLELIFAFIFNFFQILFFQTFFKNEYYIITQIVDLFHCKLIYTNTIENFVSILFTEIFLSSVITENEKIKYERIRSDNERYKYNQLKSQINPHFLFNSFNVLNEMLYIEKPERSSEYVSSLSDFYRYVLANQEHETVLLKEELDFIEHYISILTIRYSNNLIVDISVLDSDLEKKVIPMTLQILIENAVKHNIISNEEQLKVNIESDGDYIIVSNKVNLRMDKIDSTGIGLNNLIESYKLFSGKRVEIINENINFIVKVPLI